jgi:hypothetical protein
MNVVVSMKKFTTAPDNIVFFSKHFKQYKSIVSPDSNLLIFVLSIGESETTLTILFTLSCSGLFMNDFIRVAPA